jgi:N6-adenosine-specific RNA methylase IME4
MKKPKPKKTSAAQRTAWAQQKRNQREAKRKAAAAAKAKPKPSRPRVAGAVAVAVVKVTTINPKAIRIGERHRKDFGDLKGLAQSIDDRGGLLQPIAITPAHELIAGERRLRAWALSRFAGQPIPCHVIAVDAVVAGEWDENAQRKDFSPTEAVAIKRTLQDVLKRIAAARPTTQRAAPGRKAAGEGTGRVNDKIGKLTGVARRTLEKAEAIVEAAEREPEKFGDLQREMDKSGKVNAAHKKLVVRKARAAIEAAPPPLPMNLRECGTVVIDFPWAAEPEREQASIDASDRAFRPYPEMSIKQCCAFASGEIAPQLADQVTVWLWVTNFILVRGYAAHVIAALGFKPESASTLLTWDKVELGRGRLLREQTEHAILLQRGKPLVDVFGGNPPTTLLREPRRENSRKPESFYRLVERVTPAKRYASIFSRGGEGSAWDGHGDQVGKFAPAIAREAEAALIAEAKAPAPVADAIAGEIERTVDELDRVALEAFAEGDFAGINDDDLADLRKRGLVTGNKAARLTKKGLARLDELRQAAEGAEAACVSPAPVEPVQVDLEEAIAAKTASDDPGDIPDFLDRRKGRAAAA